MSSFCPSMSTPFDDIVFCPGCGLSEMKWTEYDEETCQVDIESTPMSMECDCCSPECANLVRNGLKWKHHTPSWREIVTIKDEKPVTDPYGSLSYCCGDDEDFYCFEYYIIGDKVLMHSVINSETGSFIMGSEYELVSFDAADDYAVGMFDQAVEWYHCDRTDDPIGEFSSSVDAFRKDLGESINALQS